MFIFDFKLLPAVTLALALSSTVSALPPDFDKTWVDITKPQNATELVNDKLLDKVVKPDTAAFLASYQIHFATQNEYKVQKATESVAITGWTLLMGVPDQVFQEITDESAAYAEQKWGEVYGTAIPESEFAKHKKWPEIESKYKAEEYGVETKRGLVDAAPVGGSHYKKFARGGVPPKGQTSIKGGMSLYKIQLEQKATLVHIGYGINFSVISGGGITHDRNHFLGDTATATLEIEPLLTGAGGAMFFNTKMKASGTSLKKNAALTDNSWVKNVVQKDGPVWEIEADPVKFKEASLTILKGMIDLETAKAKAVKAGEK